MKYLIAGGLGFLGTNLAIRLVNLGHSVVIYDNRIFGENGNREILVNSCGNRCSIKNIDITKLTSMESEIEDIDGIFNLACLASPPRYQKYPVFTMMTNVLGVYNLLEIAKRMKIKILHASTSEIYGDPNIHPQNEDYWGNVNCYGPRSCYDEGKRAAESLLYEYHKEYNVDTKIVRIFNTYGPFMDVDDGRVVSNFIIQALSNKPITIYGTGEQTRSFCYVDDMIEGLVKSFESDYNKPINLGNPEEFSIYYLASKVIQLTNSKSEIIFLPQAKDDPKQRKPDITRAKTLLAWEPKFSLENGLKKSILYFESIMEKS